jgi:hypothetical protein
MTLGEALAELELATIAMGDDTPLDGELLHLATLAVASRWTELGEAP